MYIYTDTHKHIADKKQDYKHKARTLEIAGHCKSGCFPGSTVQCSLYSAVTSRKIPWKVTR